MAFTLSAATFTCFSQQLQFPSLVPSLKSYPLLFSFFSTSSSSSTRRKRIKCAVSVRASATAAVESGNGAVLTEEKRDTSSYGRLFFPLAAVVGQVLYLFSVCGVLVVNLTYFLIW